jgi:hypothetical protein
MTSIRKARELARPAASAAVVTLLAISLPKCPLCVAAYLIAFGISASVAHAAAPFVQPLAFALVAATLVALTLGAWRLRHREAQPTCCSVTQRRPSSDAMA